MIWLKQRIYMIGIIKSPPEVISIVTFEGDFLTYTNIISIRQNHLLLYAALH